MFRILRLWSSVFVGPGPDPLADLGQVSGVGSAAASDVLGAQVEPVVDVDFGRAGLALEAPAGLHRVLFAAVGVDDEWDGLAAIPIEIFEQRAAVLRGDAVHTDGQQLPRTGLLVALKCELAEGRTVGQAVVGRVARERKPGLNVGELAQQLYQRLCLGRDRDGLEGEHVDARVNETAHARLVPLLQSVLGDAGGVVAGVFRAVVQTSAVGSTGAGDERLSVDDGGLVAGLVVVLVDRLDRELHSRVDEVEALLLGGTQVLREPGHRGLVRVRLDDVRARSQKVQVRRQHRVRAGHEVARGPQGIAIDLVADVGRQLRREAPVQHFHARHRD